MEDGFFVIPKKIDKSIPRREHLKKRIDLQKTANVAIQSRSFDMSLRSSATALWFQIPLTSFNRNKRSCDEAGLMAVTR